MKLNIDSCRYLVQTIYIQLKVCITNSLNFIVFVSTVRLCDNDHVDEHYSRTQCLRLMNVKWLLQILKFIFCFALCFLWMFLFLFVCSCYAMVLHCVYTLFNSKQRSGHRKATQNKPLEWLLTRNIDRIKRTTDHFYYMKSKAMNASAILINAGLTAVSWAWNWLSISCFDLKEMVQLEASTISGHLQRNPKPFNAFSPIKHAVKIFVADLAWMNPWQKATI